ncbi:MAG: transglutaminase-like cysteine peptidase [Gammaproteobacteria bacterium]|nr:transglutaminase-like cysteine peptidase [Gammaproteobacteria bacterium]MCP5407362.1 transglutaminase-like cysteine peptidase [Chromatiaceae bacterium]MCP5409007.1 transglutaminase-like cysteine peptidase [Chromatiaceae bacterium]MCP5441898.1 transglutaminase-like cysteine peptidase [Chromatiaceae bacterium]
MSENRNKDEPTKLLLVNDFFNRLKFSTDLKLWGKEDYWATPVEAMGIGGADCEDYSIAKYFTLRELGVQDDKLRIMYVKAVSLNQAHMVLAYYKTPGSVPEVLDNIVGKIVPADQRPDLVPVYSFNASDLWLAKSRGLGQYVGKSDRIGLWQDLRKRMEIEDKR